MKKIFLIVVMALMTTIVVAQSEEKKGIEVGVQMGLASLVNSPAISPIGGSPEIYTGIDYHLNIGYRHGANSYAFVYGGIPLYTEYATHFETTAQFEFSLKYRRFFRVEEWLEPFFGAGVGAVCAWSGFDYEDSRYENTWWNNIIALEIGVLIEVNRMSFFDISVGLFSGGQISHRNIVIPTGFQPTERVSVSGYRVALGYGFRF